MNMIKAKIKESEQVQEVITELRDKEQMLQEQELFSSLTSKATPAPAEPAQTEPSPRPRPWLSQCCRSCPRARLSLSAGP